MCPEAMLIGNVANLPKHAVLVFVAIATLDFHWMVALLLFPLLVALVIYYFVAVFVRIILVMLMVLMMLICSDHSNTEVSRREVRYCCANASVFCSKLSVVVI